MLEDESALAPVPSIGNAGPSSETLLAFDPKDLQEYLEQLLPLVLGADLSDLQNSIFAYPDTIEKFKRFASDAQSQVLFVLKEREGGKDEGKQQDEGGRTKQGDTYTKDAILDEATPITYSYSLSQEITYLPTHVGSLAIIKRSATLDPSRPLQAQLQLINLPGAPNASEPGQASAYEFLHSYIHLAVSPYFNAYVNARHGTVGAESSKSKNEDNKMGVPMAKKKMAELELSLLHLQQNVEIPDISLNIHPVVQKAVDKVIIWVYIHPIASLLITCIS